MIAVVQRVAHAAVVVDDETVGQIGRGFLVLLGVAAGDTETDADYVVNKLLGLRIMPDEAGKMNLSVGDVGGELLMVSQFTLLADTRKGNRPSFVRAAPPAEANRLYEYVCAQASHKLGRMVAKGVFGADMKVTLLNDGPVTILLDSAQRG